MKITKVLAAFSYLLGGLVFIIGFLVSVFCAVFGFWMVAGISLKVITVAGILWFLGGIWLYLTGVGLEC